MAGLKRNCTDSETDISDFQNGRNNEVNEMTKFLHVVNRITDGMKVALEEVPRRGGMYNWMFLYKGDIQPFNRVEDFEKYDIVQLNMAPADQILVHEVAKKVKNTSTVFVANNDYVTECWDAWGQHPKQYQQLQEVPDALFGTEPHQVSNMIEGAYCIPHPHWVKMLKHIGNDDLYEERPMIGVLYHWWEGKTYNTVILLDRIRKKYPKLLTRLYGYNGKNDKISQWQRMCFDEIEKLMSYPDFIRGLMRNRVIIENCSYHTYGRTSVDTAALRIPTMGTNRIDSMNRCFPNMVADPYDLKTQYKILNRMLSDDKWLQEQMDYAYDACEYYNYKNAKERFDIMVEETRRKMGK